METTAQNQIAQPSLATVGPVHDVMGVAQWRLSQPGNWHWLRSRSCRTRRRAVGTVRYGPAAGVEHLAVGAMAQHHQAGIAGHAAHRVAADVKSAGLIDHRLTGVAVGCRSRRLRRHHAELAPFRGNCARQSLEWGKVM